MIGACDLIVQHCPLLTHFLARHAAKVHGPSTFAKKTLWSFLIISKMTTMYFLIFCPLSAAYEKNYYFAKLPSCAKWAFFEQAERTQHLFYVKMICGSKSESSNKSHRRNISKAMAALTFAGGLPFLATQVSLTSTLSFTLITGPFSTKGSSGVFQTFK